MRNEVDRFSLLLVDDEPQITYLLEKTFTQEDYDIHTAHSGREALELLEKKKVDAALIDLIMPEMDGLTLLKNIKKQCPAVMAIMLTGQGGITDAVKAIKLGAIDFLEKPFSPEGMRVRVAQLYKIWELKEENRNLREKIQNQFGFHDLVGNSTAILKLKELIAQVSPIDATVLIQGETGTGKELVARAIHFHSLRNDNNFVPVDCAAISETVIESELFGHFKGAYTGAHISTEGLIRTADKGTLFLDEVGELSPAIQSKFLRTIQEKEVRPVGSSRSFPADIRILAATNRNLEEEIKKGAFREDLFFRLNVLTIHVPPLKDRKADIPLLVRHFIKRFATDYSTVEDISKEALFCMEDYDWQGNIRELENVVRRAVALGKEDVILPDDLPPSLYKPPGGRKQPMDHTSDGSLASYEISAIRNALATRGNNRKEAAKILQIGEATLYRKIKKYGL